MEMAVSAMITAPSLISPPRNILGKRSSTDFHHKKDPYYIM